MTRRSQPEYRPWNMMLQRCTNPRYTSYSYYGGRGISVCARWSSFDLFLQDVGRRPSLQHSLDRIDNAGNYEPGNVRWATRSEQMRNTRGARLITFRGVTKCLCEWAAEVGIHEAAIGKRIDRGWSVEEALTRPATRANRMIRAKERLYPVVINWAVVLP